MFQEALMFRSFLKESFAAFRLFALLFTSVLFLTASSLEAHAQTGTVQPFVLCYTYNPYSQKVQFVLGYTSSYTKTQFFAPGTVANFFAPGEPDVGQPGQIFAGNDQDLWVHSLSLLENDFLIWGINGTTLRIDRNAAPPCVPAYFVPGPNLAFATPGTYTNQYLGSITAPNAGIQGATVFPIGAAAGLSITNIHASTKQFSFTDPANPQGGVNGEVTTAAFYADVTVAPGPAISTGLLVDVTADGNQLALGQVPITFAGSAPDTTGCPAVVTSQVKGQISAARQLLDTGIWTQVVTIKNTSGKAIAGPIHLALAGLSSNAKLFTASGTGTCPDIAGEPFITVTTGLPANGNAAVVLTFTNSGMPSTAISYTPVVVAGGSRL